MDTRFRDVVSESAFAVCIVGNLELTDFALLDFGSEESEGVLPLLAGRGYQFVGVMGLGRQDGKPHTALNVEVSDDARKSICAAYVQGILKRCGARLHEELVEEIATSREVKWLTDLHNLDS